jgi:AraC-like DNA-binding protein
MITYTGTIYECDTYTGSEDTANPFFINCCGYIKFLSKSASLNRARLDYYLIYLVNGAGYYRLDGMLQRVPAGSIVLYQPHERQDYFYKSDEQTELYWIHFTGTAAGRFLESLGFLNGNVFQVGIHSECVQLFEKIIHEIHIGNPQYHAFCIGYLMQLLSVFSREHILIKNGSRNFKNSDIESVIRKMQLEYQKDHDISYYAQYCNLSVYQFIRKFKAATHLSPARYIEKIRMDKSRELLVGTDLTINEISSVVGFGDPFYFSKVFKKSTGLNPMSFRKEKKG